MPSGPRSMDARKLRWTALVLVLLVAGAGPMQVAAHGASKTIEKSEGPYRVVLFTFASILEGERTALAFNVTFRADNRSFDDNATLVSTFYDDGGARLARNTTTAEVTRARGAVYQVARLTVPQGSRKVDWSLKLPNATVTFTQNVSAQATSSGPDRPAGESTPLASWAAPAAMGLAGLWWLRRRR